VPSDSEGHPMVVLEAMRSSVAIAATNVGGLPEVLGPCRFIV
jgi:glycosyltransferase involved in cell wall biosynthesis